MICNNCKHHNKKYNLCSMGIFTAATKDKKQPLDRCDYKPKAPKVKRNG